MNQERPGNHRLVTSLCQPQNFVGAYKLTFLFFIVNYSLTLLRNIFFTRYLSMADWGMYALFLSYVEFFIHLILLGLPLILLRFAYQYWQQNKLLRFVRKVAWLPLLLALTLLFASLGFLDRLSEIFFTAKPLPLITFLVFVCILLVLPYRALHSLFQGLRLFRMRVGLEFSNNLLSSGLGIIAVVFIPTLLTVVTCVLLGYLASVAVFGGIAIFFFVRQGQTQKIDEKRLLGRMLAFGGWQVVANLAFLTTGNVGRWTINQIEGPASVAPFSLALNFVTLFFMMIMLFQDVLLANAVIYWEQKETNKVNWLLNMSCKFILIVHLIGVMLFNVFAVWLFPLLFGDQYAGTEKFFRLLALGEGGRIVYWVLGALLILQVKTKQAAGINLVALMVCTAGSLFLVKLISISGGALATSVASIAMGLVTLYFVRRGGLKVDRRIFLLCVMYLLLLIPHPLVVFSLLLGFLALGLGSGRIFASDEKDFLISTVRKKLFAKE